MQCEALSSPTVREQDTKDHFRPRDSLPANLAAPFPGVDGRDGCEPRFRQPLFSSAVV